MNSWSNLYDNAKDRRYGMLFFVTFITLLGCLALWLLIHAIFGVSDIPALLLSVSPGIVIFFVVLVLRIIHRVRIQRGNKFQRQKLSRDEIVKARSKLVNKNKT
jgi:hypothetical protein